MEQQGNPNPYGVLYPPNPSVQSAATELTYQQIQQQDQLQLRQQLQSFWSNQETEKVNEFKNHSLPLARIKKIMKADGDVRMISAEAPVIFARACEMFILELTLRSWSHTEESRRRTLQKNDIAASISRTDIFDFLVDTVPKEEGLKDDVFGVFPQENTPVIAQGDAVQYYYMQAAQNGPVMMGTPVMDPNVYGQQSQAYVAPGMWQQAPPHMRAPLPPSDN